MRNSSVSYLILLVLVTLGVGLTISGCDKLNTGNTGTVDKNLVGVWFSAVEKEGMEIKSDGKVLNVVVNTQGKLAYDTSANQAVVTISTGNNIVTATIKEKSWLTGKDTTYTETYGYLLSNNNNTLTVTETVNGQVHSTQYSRVNIGDNPPTPTPASGVSLTMDGTTYTFSSLLATAQHDTVGIHGSNTQGHFLIFTLRKALGAQQIGNDIVEVLLSVGTTQYGSNSGTVTVTSITGNTLIGTIDVVMVNTATQATFPATGSFNITHQ
jgi:hypothetical protein